MNHIYIKNTVSCILQAKLKQMQLKPLKVILASASFISTAKADIFSSIFAKFE